MIRSLGITWARFIRINVPMKRLRGTNRSFAAFYHSASRGFTLMEVMICLLIVMMAAIATIGAITYSRLNMELEKQRLAALNFCRQSMEGMQSLDTAYAGTKRLVPFNAPGIEDLNANIRVEYFKLKDTGVVDWNTSLTAPLLEEPIYARVSVAWVPYGSQNRPQEVSMSTILTRGID